MQCDDTVGQAISIEAVANRDDAYASPSTSTETVRKERCNYCNSEDEQRQMKDSNSG